MGVHSPDSKHPGRPRLPGLYWLLHCKLQGDGSRGSRLGYSWLACKSRPLGDRPGGIRHSSMDDGLQEKRENRKEVHGLGIGDWAVAAAAPIKRSSWMECAGNNRVGYIAPVSFGWRRHICNKQVRKKREV